MSQPHTSGDPPADAARASVLAARLALQGDRLAALFRALYGADPRCDSLLAALFDLITQACLSRPSRAARLDAARGANPAWYLGPEQLGYCCYVDRFAGTLIGVRARIPYLRELGVTYLHLLPFWRRPPGDSDGGFAVSDYESADPRFGADADLADLADALAEAGITLCGDLVLNHTADDHAWARAAKSGDPGYRDFYHIFPDRTLPDQYEASLAEVFPADAPGNFTLCADLKAWVWTTFYPYQWDLNWANPAVLVEMCGVILRLANRGIGAFRLDSAGYLWKRLCTRCVGEPEVHTILRLLRAMLDIAAPGVLLKAEAILPSIDLPLYLGFPDQPGRECHIAYQASLMTAAWASLAEQRADLVHAVLERAPDLAGHASWLTYVRCHDDIGWRIIEAETAATGDPDSTRLATIAAYFANADKTSPARGAAFQNPHFLATNGMTAALTGIQAGQETADPALIETGIARLLLLYALAFSAGGMPLIYMGDELAQTNAPPPDAGEDGRWLHRPFFDEKAASARYDESQTAGEIFTALATLARSRAACRDLAADRPLRLRASGDPALLCFTRGDSLLCLFNFADHPVPIAAIFPRSAGGLRDIATGAMISADHRLAAFAFLWLDMRS